MSNLPSVTMVFFYRHPPLTFHIPQPTAHIPHTSFLLLGLCTYHYMYMTKPMWHWTLTAYNQHLRLSPSHNLTLTLLVCTRPTIRPSLPRFSVPVKQFSAPTVIPHNVCYLVFSHVGPQQRRRPSTAMNVASNPYPHHLAMPGSRCRSITPPETVAFLAPCLFLPFLCYP